MPADGMWIVAPSSSCCVVWAGCAAAEDGLHDIANIPVKNAEGVVVCGSATWARVAYGAEIRQGAISMSTRDAAGTPRQLGEVV